MLIYWMLVAVPAALSLGENPRQSQASFRMFAFLLLAVLFVVLAFRETGGDYLAYSRTLEVYDHSTLIEWVQLTEPLYGGLNWLAVQVGGGIYFVNGACAILFLFALGRFARSKTSGFFLITLAVPYLVIVVAMGYTRQGVATAFLMLGMGALRQGRIPQYLVMIALGCGFHSSLAIFAALPVVSPVMFRSPRADLVWRVILTFIALAALPSLFRERAGDYVEFYIESDRYQSSGALLRGGVTAIAAVVFVLLNRTWRARFNDFGLWLPFAALSFANIPFSFISSTAADRIGLYLIPFQILVFARLPGLAPTLVAGLQIKLIVLAGYLSYFYVWLHLGTFAQDLWVPYIWYFSP